MTSTAYNASISYNSPISYLGAAVQNVSFSESLTANDAEAASATVSLATSESLTAADGLSAVATANPSVTESLGAADSLAATAQASVTVLESLTPEDSLAASAAFSVAFTEAIQAMDVLQDLILVGTPASRTFTVGVTRSSRFLKDPDARLDYQVDWSAWLDTDDIGQSTWLVPPGLTVYATTSTTRKTAVWVSGGGEGAEYLLVNRITTASGRIVDQTITVRIRSA